MIVLWCNLQKLEVLGLRRASLFVFTSSSRRIEWPCRQNIWRFEQFRWNIRAIQEAPVRLWTQNYSCWLKDAKISLIFKRLIFDLPALWICLFCQSVSVCIIFHLWLIKSLCLFIALFVCLCVYLFIFCRFLVSCFQFVWLVLLLICLSVCLFISSFIL